MMQKTKEIVVVIIAIILIIALFAFIFYSDINPKEENGNVDLGICLPEGVKKISKTYNFSEPNLIRKGDFIAVEISEAELQSMGDGRPVLPYNLTKYEFPFGTKIIDVVFENSTPETLSISNKISYASCSTLTKDDEIRNSIIQKEILTYLTKQNQKIL